MRQEGESAAFVKGFIGGIVLTSSLQATPERLRELADSYLDHMLIIIRVDDRGANPRDILDPWWSFTRGYPFVHGKGNFSQVTMNNPCSSDHARLRKLDWISAGAKAALTRAIRKAKDEAGRDVRGLSDQLIVEHSVPFAVIMKEIWSQAPHWDRESLREFLSHHFKRALLTKEENARLRVKEDGQSLDSEMPMGWKRGGDPFVRYRSRGIEPARTSLDN